MSNNLKISPYVGIEIGGTKLQAIAVTESGAVLAQCSDTVAPKDGAATIRARLVKMIRPLCEEFSPAAIGVGFGGPLDWRTGTIARSFHVTGWTDFPLAQWLRSEFEGPAVFIENDSNAAAYAEAFFGAGRAANPVLYSNSGSGVGAGLVVDGRLYRGLPPGELEIGHLRLDASGCIVEQMASGWSLDQRVLREASGNPDGRLARLLAVSPGAGARVLGRALVENDAAATQIFNDAARSYALGLSHAVHLLHPEVIVLGGGVSLIGEPWRAAVARNLPGFLMEAFAPGPKILLSELGTLVVPLGAALLARDRHRTS